MDESWVVNFVERLGKIGVNDINLRCLIHVSLQSFSVIKQVCYRRSRLKEPMLLWYYFHTLETEHRSEIGL
jgi:hypothetical protein